MNNQETQAKDSRLETRIPASIKNILQRAAELQGQTLTDFVLSSTTEAARRIIREHELLELSERDQIAFARTLLSPPKSNSRLNRAARDYLKSGR